ncbi:MAG: VUT family protein [Thermoleophilia bacterium]|nr:VUT family protein [Thermoleophilia bacterium]
MSEPSRRAVGAVAALAFVATVFAANWAINRFGIVSVGFGLRAPAAVFFAGLAFTLRDLVQRTLNKKAVIAAIVVGALCSAFVSPHLAFASGSAFLVSELCDFAVYTPLARTRPITAGVASNTVGAAVDSYLFLSLAFGSLAFFWGQVVGKTWVTLATLAVLLAARTALRARAGSNVV